jgi:hypothetical protein
MITTISEDLTAGFQPAAVFEFGYGGDNGCKTKCYED